MLRTLPRAAVIITLGAGCTFDTHGLAPRTDDRAQVVLDGAVDSDGARGDGRADGGRPPIDGARMDSTAPKRWWDVSWTRRRRLTFKNPNGADDLLDFPLLVTLDATRITYGSTQPNGEDLRFVDADNTTLLAHQIERWDAKGASAIWVRVPQLDRASTTDHIWLYYGNATPSGNGQSPAVWSNGYVGVWHFDPDLKDSTSYQNNAADKGATASSSGKIAGAMKFDATKKQYLELPNTNSLILNELTVELWVRTKQVWDQNFWPGNATLISRGTVPLESNDWTMIGGKNSGESGNAGRVIVGVGTKNDPTIASAKLKNNDVFHYIVWSRTAAGHQAIYCDGVREAMLTDSGGTIAADRAMQVGGDPATSGEYLDGLIDELRLSKVVRSLPWINAQHRSMTDQLIDYATNDATN